MVLAEPVNLRLYNYWQKTAKYYDVSDVFGRKILKTFLYQIHPQSLIELGCGPGELFPLYEKIPRVVAIDWSSNMLDRARRRVNRHEYCNIELRQMDITEKFVDERFDVLVTRTVLMHIHPDHIRTVAKHVSRMSNELLLFEYWEEYPSKPLEFHNWLYNYVPLFENEGYRTVETFYRPDDVKQVLFHFKR